VDVLVATTGEVDHQRLARTQAWRQLGRVSERMARLECRNDALGQGQGVERGQRLAIVDGDVGRAAAVLEPGVLRTNARVVETE